MYEKTIANDFRIYSIIATNTPTLIVNLLSPAARADYESIVGGAGLASNRPIEGRPNNAYRRTPLDGYILSYTDTFQVGSSATGEYETVQPGVQYTNPVYFWPDKTWIIGNDIVAFVRIFFS